MVLGKYIFTQLRGKEKTEFINLDQLFSMNLARILGRIGFSSHFKKKIAQGDSYITVFM